jgi:thioredoxin-related protein
MHVPKLRAYRRADAHALAHWLAMLEASAVKNLVLALVAVSGFVLPMSARADPAWQTDYKKAQQDAKANNRLLLLNFTGSDWCGYCIVFDREVLSKPQFKDYASKNLVLMEVDFPRRKTQNLDTRKQNQELAEQFQIEGFPTIVVLDGDGRKVWQYEGLFPGSLGAFIAQLEKLRKS